MSAGPQASSPAQRRRDRERAATRATILGAALEVARRYGWQAVTMRRLADEIEYSANFAYRYFTGREDILLAVVQDGFARLRDAMTAARDATDAGAGDSRAPQTAAFRRAAHAYLDFALAEPELYQLMYGLGGVRVPVNEAWDDGQAVGDVLIGLLVAAGDDQAERRVLQLWAGAHGLIALRAVGRLVIDGSGLHALLDHALDEGLADHRPPGA